MMDAAIALYAGGVIAWLVFSGHHYGLAALCALAFLWRVVRIDAPTPARAPDGPDGRRHPWVGLPWLVLGAIASWAMVKSSSLMTFALERERRARTTRGLEP